MKLNKKLLAAAIIIFIITGSIWADTYSILDKQQYVIRNVYEISNEGISPVYNLSIKVLSGADTDSLYQELLDTQIFPGVSNMEKDDWGNNYAKIDILSLNPGKKINIIIENTIANSGISFNKDIYIKNADYSGFLMNNYNYKYILPGEKTESDSDAIKTKAIEIAKTGTVMEKAKRIYDFVNLHIDYNENPLFANKGALSGLLTGKGVCDEFSFLFTAMCRAVGIPSRVVAGYWIENDIEENEWLDISYDRHSWSEFYVPDIGWVPAEPTFRYIHNGKRTPNDEYFANIKSDDRHFINNYIARDIRRDLDVQFKHDKSEAANLVLKSVDESIKLLGEDFIYRIKLADINNNWAESYIKALYNDGIVYPKEDALYKPYENITRGEFAAYIVNAIGIGDAGKTTKYKDVSSENPYEKQINAATEAGLIQGFNGYFYPENSITRQDAAVIMKRALDYLNIGQTLYSVALFEDRDLISDYAVNSVDIMYELNIMKGKPGNIFAPVDVTSRAEAAKIIWEFINLLYM